MKYITYQGFFNLITILALKIAKVNLNKLRDRYKKLIEMKIDEQNSITTNLKGSEEYNLKISNLQNSINSQSKLSDQDHINDLFEFLGLFNNDV